MSKFQRKLAEKMGEDTMTIPVKDWDEMKRASILNAANRVNLKTALEELQTIKEIINVMIHNSIYSGIKNKHKKYHIDDYYINRLKELAK